MYNIENLTVREFLEKIAAPGFPGPASGSAAAATAAMAAALLEMSCAVTIKKDEQKRSLTESVEKVKAIREHCLYLATEDMKAYAEVVDAAKSKKEFPDAYEAAMKKATETLVSVVKDSTAILTAIEQIMNICCKKVLGDLGGSAYMAAAAAAAAKQGVEVNLRFLHDEGYKTDRMDLVRESHRKSVETKDRIAAVITDLLG